jgi:uncharacterized glyoxalase superfamily protein PhnB
VVYKIEKMVIALSVPSIEDTIDWYQKVLGWKGHQDVWDEGGNCLFGSVGHSFDPFMGFNLSRLPGDHQAAPDHPTPCRFWIYVNDVDAVYQRVIQRGVQPEPPEDRFWGERTFQMVDLNGYELIFAQGVEDLGIDEIRARHQVLLRDQKGADQRAD